MPNAVPSCRNENGSCELHWHPVQAPSQRSGKRHREDISRIWTSGRLRWPRPLALTPPCGHTNWVRQREGRTEGILGLGPVVKHCNPLTRCKHELRDIDRVGKRVLAQRLISVMITVAARIRAVVMQLRHRRAEQCLGLRLNRLVEPGVQSPRELASHYS